MKILFVCIGNVARSQMAEALFNAKPGSHTASSAGVASVMEGSEGMPLKAVGPDVVRAMADIGIDVSEKISKQLAPEMIKDADLVVYLGIFQWLPDWMRLDPKARGWDVADPAGHGYEAHVAARQDIESRVLSLLQEIGN